MRKEPEGVELMEDTSPARWLEEHFWAWKNSYGAHEFRVGSLLPEGFAAYARVFHPAILRPNEWVRWSTVASWTGRTVHPEMQFARIANLEPHQTPPWGWLPRYGSLRSEECHTIAKVLREFTSTPDSCYFCIWEGYGFLGDPGRYQKAPRVRVPHRGYLLFRGPLDAVMAFTDTFRWQQSPNIWWPEDRAWCVATEIDMFETYVGGSDACIQRILSCPDLEALPTTIEARVDIWGDTINV